MTGLRFAVALWLAALPGLAVAAPPETSLRPQHRGQEGALPMPGLVPIALPTAPPPGLIAPAAKAAPEGPGIRPRPRPAQPAAEVAGAATDRPAPIRPRPRPAMAERPAAFLQAAVSSPLAVLVAPRPLPRPESPGRLNRVRAVAFVTQPLPGAISGRKGTVCGDPAIKGMTIPPIAAKVKGCGLRDGVRVTSVAGVQLSSPADLDCATASALREWVEGTAIPAVGTRGGGLRALHVAASYVCRPRNNQRGAKVSEHGRGRAIDIAGYILADGAEVSVLQGWGSAAHGKTLASMRKGACGTFNTVLGPGSDRFHADHLHLDTARGRGAYCR